MFAEQLYLSNGDSMCQRCVKYLQFARDFLKLYINISKTLNTFNNTNKQK